MKVGKAYLYDHAWNYAVHSGQSDDAAKDYAEWYIDQYGDDDEEGLDTPPHSRAWLTWWGTLETS